MPAVQSWKEIGAGVAISGLIGGALTRHFAGGTLLATAHLFCAIPLKFQLFTRNSLPDVLWRGVGSLFCAAKLTCRIFPILRIHPMAYLICLIVSSLFAIHELNKEIQALKSVALPLKV